MCQFWKIHCQNWKFTRCLCVFSVEHVWYDGYDTTSCGQINYPKYYTTTTRTMLNMQMCRARNSFDSLIYVYYIFWYKMNEQARENKIERQYTRSTVSIYRLLFMLYIYEYIYMCSHMVSLCLIVSLSVRIAMKAIHRQIVQVNRRQNVQFYSSRPKRQQQQQPTNWLNDNNNMNVNNQKQWGLYTTSTLQQIYIRMRCVCDLIHIPRTSSKSWHIYLAYM